MVPVSDSQDRESTVLMEQSRLGDLTVWLGLVLAVPTQHIGCSHHHALHAGGKGAAWTWALYIRLGVMLDGPCELPNLGGSWYFTTVEQACSYFTWPHCTGRGRPTFGPGGQWWAPPASLPVSIRFYKGLQALAK